MAVIVARIQLLLLLLWLLLLLFIVVVGLTRAKIDNYCLHNINISRQGCLCAGCVCACVCESVSSRPLTRYYHSSFIYRSNTLRAVCLILFVNKITVFVAKIRRRNTTTTQSHFTLFLSVCMHIHCTLYTQTVRMVFISPRIDNDSKRSWSRQRKICHPIRTFWAGFRRDTQFIYIAEKSYLCLCVRARTKQTSID